MVFLVKLAEKMKNLSDFKSELSQLGFDKKKVQGLVKRANNSGYDIYYTYHEDGPDTWKHGWSTSDYKKDDTDVKLFEITELIGKSKGGGSFRKGQTYTAECAIFVFCPVKTLLKDAELRILKINSVKNWAKEYAQKYYQIALKAKKEFDNFKPLAVENVIQIEKLRAEISENLGQPGSRKVRAEKEAKINELGGNMIPFDYRTSTWMVNCLNYTLEDYIKIKQEEAVAEFLKIEEVEVEVEAEV